MKDQIIEVNGQCPGFRQAATANSKIIPASYPDAAFWMRVYPPLAEFRISIPHARMLCPWSMAAELNDEHTHADRRANIMNALKSGLKTIRQYDLPACRIIFAEEHSNRNISVWVD